MVAIDSDTLNQIIQAFIALLLIIIAWYNRQRTASATTTAAATMQIAAAAAATPPPPPTPAPVVAASLVPGANIVTNLALMGLAPVVQIGGTTYHPVYLMSAETRRAVGGQLSPGDLALVDGQIAAAESQRGGLGIPHYFITYSTGFYEINYGVVNSGADTYFASTIISSSHDQTYDAAKAKAAAIAARDAALAAAAAAAANTCHKGEQTVTVQ
jgi:hypothetical protein